jgi:hypothetical protein
MAQEVLTCDEPWTGTTCNGTVESVDIEGALTAAAGFDWDALDVTELSQLFATGFGIVLGIWFVALGVGAVFDVIRKS